MSSSISSNTSGAFDKNKTRIAQAGSIFLVVLGVYFFISLLSFNASDPSWINNASSQQINNWGGLGGAWIAATLNFLLGYASFWLVIILLTSVYLLLHRDKRPNGRLLIVVFSHGFMLTGLCGLLALHFSGGGMLASAGGWFGQVSANGLVYVFGHLGATLFLIAITLSGIQLLTDASWLNIMDFVGAQVLKSGSYMQGLKKFWRERKINEDNQTKRKVAVEQSKRILHTDRKVTTRVEPSIPKLKPSKKASVEKQIPLFINDDQFTTPPLSLLEDAAEQPAIFSNESLDHLSKQLEVKLNEFGVKAEVVKVQTGPVVTLFEIMLAPGTQARKLTSLEKDLARALSAYSVRVVEIIPGKPHVGIEIPNEIRQVIALSEILNSAIYEKNTSSLPLALGKNTIGETVIIDLKKLPHLLVAGTTGSGKSVALHAMLMSMLFKLTPQQVRMILIDPKMLELNVYADIPHLLTPVVTDVKLATHALRWTVAEMERRYRLMSEMGVRNIEMCNHKIIEARKEKMPLKDPTVEAVEGQEVPELETLPYIVVVIDEFADMIMVVGKKIEDLIVRIAQKARAAGIHLLIATQRPSVDVITGLVKANIPSRLAFQVSSSIDSRTIIDQKGAEQLLGQGDMLYLASGSPAPERVHGAFVSEEEVHEVVAFLKKQGKANYIKALEQINEGNHLNVGAMSDTSFEDDEDELYGEACHLVREKKNASISALQRRLRIGYNRAARMVEKMEEQGIVSAVQSNGSREVIAPRNE